MSIMGHTIVAQLLHTLSFVSRFIPAEALCFEIFSCRSTLFWDLFFKSTKSYTQHETRSAHKYFAELFLLCMQLCWATRLTEISASWNYTLLSDTPEIFGESMSVKFAREMSRRRELHKTFSGNFINNAFVPKEILYMKEIGSIWIAHCPFGKW